MSTWTNLNTLFNSVANEQNIEPGTPEWRAGGLQPYSGTTGPHGAYGWRHDHKVDPDYARAVIANYCHRGVYYQGEGARWRMFGYEQGGRPRGWTPEDPQDLPNGHRAYMTSEGVVAVSGPDLEHLWLEPLWALIDGPEVTVQCLGDDVLASWVARIVATYQVASAMGMIRQPGKTEAFPWGWGNRSSSRLLSTIDQAARRGCLHGEDGDTAFSWLRDGFLPIYETGAGIQRSSRSPAGTYEVHAYNGLYWLIPALWDATRKNSGISHSPEKDRLRTILKRFCQWALDLERLSTEMGQPSAFGWESFSLPVGLTEPPESIANIVGNITQATSDVTPWTYRACAIAAEVTDAPVLINAEQTIWERHAGDPAQRAWMVGPDGEYVGAP